MEDMGESNISPAFDRDTFEALFRLHFTGLCLAAYQLVADEDAAKDIVQEFFMYCWNKRMLISLKGEFKNYAFRAIRNASLNYLKKSSKIAFFDQEAIFASSDPLEESDNREAERKRDAELWAAIDHLPVQRKQIFLMSNRDGYTYAQVAEQLNISINTVKTQIRLAYQYLREECRWLLVILVFIIF